MRFNAENCQIQHNNYNYCSSSDFYSYPYHKFVSRKFETTIPESGFCKMIFNISVYNMLTIAIKNCSNAPIEGYLEISPDNIHYKIETGSVKTIPANQLEVFVPRIFLEYISLVIQGPPGASVMVFFQGQII